MNSKGKWFVLPSIHICCILFISRVGLIPKIDVKLEISLAVSVQNRKEHGKNMPGSNQSVLLCFVWIMRRTLAQIPSLFGRLLVPITIP